MKKLKLRGTTVLYWEDDGTIQFYDEENNVCGLTSDEFEKVIEFVRTNKEQAE